MSSRARAFPACLLLGLVVPSSSPTRQGYCTLTQDCLLLELLRGCGSIRSPLIALRLVSRSASSFFFFFSIFFSLSLEVSFLALSRRPLLQSRCRGETWQYGRGSAEVSSKIGVHFVAQLGHQPCVCDTESPQQLGGFHPAACGNISA